MSSSLPAGLHEQGASGIVPVEFLTGAAGTGKTYEIRRRITADPGYGLLAATTGIAAVNLGAVTINSLLGYFDTASLEEAFYNGWLLKKLKDLASNGFKWLVIDELSMMDARQLDIIYQAVKQLNEQLMYEGEPPLGIALTGDFCQLPPIKAKWAFEATCWPEFEAATTRLTKVWRQADARFLEAINLIRSGNGPAGAELLRQLEVQFVRSADTAFIGTTIMAKNKAVDNFNWICHNRLAGVPITIKSSRWGEQRKEWANIPQEQQLKKGAYVMILANNPPEFTYANGDCGYVEDYDELLGFSIRLVRNDATVRVDEVTRVVEQKQPPDMLLSRHPGMDEKTLRAKYNGLGSEPEPYWDGERRKWILGGIIYHPLRLAYASTVHKTQGLTLDRIQVDVNDHFFGSPAMAYVSISRCKTSQGLRIVGSPQLLASRVKVAPEVVKWL